MPESHPMPLSKEPEIKPDTVLLDAAVELPHPTTDQQNYLENIKASAGRYDSTVVVGGPRRPTNHTV
jgi:hypothetical protein